jgi:hypothetical protein
LTGPFEEDERSAFFSSLRAFQIIKLRPPKKAKAIIKTTILSSGMFASIHYFPIRLKNMHRLRHQICPRKWPNLDEKATDPMRSGFCCSKENLTTNPLSPEQIILQAHAPGHPMNPNLFRALDDFSDGGPTNHKSLLEKYSPGPVSASDIAESAD